MFLAKKLGISEVYLRKLFSTHYGTTPRQFIIDMRIQKIAYEKAGIIKENSKVITATYNNGFEIIKQIAKEKNAKLVPVNYEIEMIYENSINHAIIDETKYEFPLLGLYQKQNLALVLEACRVLKINSEAIKQGLKTAKWPARLEYIKEKNILIDGAHNPDSAQELKKSLEYYFKNEKKIFIYSTIDTKDYKAIADILFTPEDEIYYLEFNHKNAVSFEQYRKDVPQLNIKIFIIFPAPLCLSYCSPA